MCLGDRSSLPYSLNPGTYNVSGKVITRQEGIGAFALLTCTLDE
jgi:hypothetical protein